MAWNTLTGLQVVLLGLAATSWAQQFQSFDDFGNAQQLQQPQQFHQPQRFASQQQPQFQPQPQPPQPQRVAPKIRRPQTKFVDPNSVSINAQSAQGVQTPRIRAPVRQQFAQPPTVTRAPVRQFQFDTQFVEPVQPPQQEFQQQPPQFQSFEPAPAPAPTPAPVVVRTRVPPQQESIAVTPVRTSRPEAVDPNAEETAQHQAENAKYSFQAAVTDSLSDNQHVREEERNGLALKGVYSYSDGYFKRTVHYEADENGYRVVNEEVEPIGDGPQEDPNGSAEVRSNVGGTNLQYTITAADIPSRLRQSQPLQQSFRSQ